MRLIVDIIQKIFLQTPLSKKKSSKFPTNNLLLIKTKPYLICHLAIKQQE